MRDRLSMQPVGDPLTSSNYIGMVFEEPIVLHSVAQRLNFLHWIEHLDSFFAYVPNLPMNMLIWHQKMIFYLKQ